MLSSRPVLITDAKSAVGLMPIFASTAYAESALGSSLTRARFLALEKPVGKEVNGYANL